MTSIELFCENTFDDCNDRDCVDRLDIDESNDKSNDEGEVYDDDVILVVNDSVCR